MRFLNRGGRSRYPAKRGSSTPGHSPMSVNLLKISSQRRPWRLGKFAGGALAAAMTIGACSGSGESPGDTGFQGDPASADDRASEDWEHARGRCDNLRADGTITNRSGEPAAFVVTYSFTYSDPSSGPGFESERTPVLSDGRSHAYRLSPSSLTEAATDCRFIGIERVELSDDELAKGGEAQEAAPDEALDAGEVDPVWYVDDYPGRILEARVADGAFFARVVDTEGYTIVRGDLSTGDVDWAAEVDRPIETFAPDGQGGVVLGLDYELRHVGSDGEQSWSVRPLQRPQGREQGVSAASIEQIDIVGDTVLVGGHGALAEVDLATGTGRWYLDHASDQVDGRDFAGGGAIARLLDGDLALVAGGSSTNDRLVLLDRSDPAGPSIVWSREEPPHLFALSDEEDLLVTVQGGQYADDLVALDVATGDEIWQVEADETLGGNTLGHPRIIRDEVVVVQRSGGSDGWDLQTGDPAWRTDDREAHLDWRDSTDGHVSAAGDPLDGQAVGLQDGPGLRIAVIDADGTLRSGQIRVDDGAIGSVSSLEVEGTLALITTSSTSPSEPSKLWLVDLSALD